MNKPYEHKSKIEKLKTKFPHCEITNLQGYGANIRIRDRVITIYWKKKKYGDSKTQAWSYFRDLPALIEILNKVDMGEIIELPSVSEIKVPVIGIIQDQENRVQQCIDHIREKRAKVELIKPNFAMITMLDNLALELEQYL